MEKKGGLDLTTIAKVSKETGVSAGALRRALKDANVQPDEVKAGCSYYSPARINGIVKKLKKA